mgnify:FL=1
MLTLYGVTGEEHERLLAMAREAADPNWVVPGLGRRVAATIASEKAARRIVNVEPMLIPGMCQTDEYARAVMGSLSVTRERADQLVATRARRRAVLTRNNPPEYVAIIGEFALRYPPCDSTAMAEQLDLLLTLGDLPNVSILVLPFAECSSSAAVLGSFSLLVQRLPDSQPRGAPVVRQENYRGTTALSNRRDVRDYQTAVEEILRKTMSAAGSRAFIAKLKKEMERESL